MAPSSLCRLGEPAAPVKQHTARLLPQMYKMRPEDKSNERLLLSLLLSASHSLSCSQWKNNLLFLKSPPDFSLSGRWIVLLIGIEMLNILMSPCIHFVARAHFSWAKALFTFSPTGHFQLIPGLTVIGSHTQTVRIRKSIIYFSSTLSAQPFCRLLPANKRPPMASFITSEVKKQ